MHGDRRCTKSHTESLKLTPAEIILQPVVSKKKKSSMGRGYAVADSPHSLLGLGLPTPLLRSFEPPPACGRDAATRRQSAARRR
jgi:hypothetical protein